MRFLKNLFKPSTKPGVKPSATSEELENPALANDAQQAQPSSHEQAYGAISGDIKQQLAEIKSTQQIDKVLTFYSQANDEIVIDCADMRLRELLTEQSEGVPVEKIKSATLSYKTQKTLATAAALPELRTHFLLQISDDLGLNEIIARTQDIEIKKQAIAKLHDLAALQALLKQAKGKDKTLYRSVKERLNEVKGLIATKEALETQAEKITQQIDEQTINEISVSRFRKQLDTATPELTVVQQQHYQNIALMADNACQELRQLRHSYQATLDRVTELQKQLDDNQLSGSEAAFLRSLETVEANWASLPDWQSAEREAFDIKFEQALQRVKADAQGYFNQQQIDKAQHQVLNQGQRWLSGSTFITENMLADWQSRWQALPIVSDAEKAKALGERYQQLLTALQAKAQKLLAEQQNNDQKAPELVAAFREHMQAGTFQQAGEAHDAILTILHSEARLSKRVHQSIIKDFQLLQSQFNELKSWQQFGSQKARESLIESMQQLADNNGMDPLLKAEAIQQLQKRWKRIEGRAPQKLWQQFQAVGNTAWAPCAAYFKAQRTQSHQLLAERLAFLDEAKKYIQAIDWDKPNWHAIDSAHRKFESVWKSFPKLQEADYIKAKKAYRDVAHDWEKRLTTERKTNLAQREKGIESIQTLFEQGNIDQAIEQIKVVRKNWTPTVPLRRRQQEQALWKRFQSVCDAVYVQHEASLSEKRAEQTAIIQQYETQLEALHQNIEQCEPIDEVWSLYRSAVAALDEFSQAPAYAQHRLSQRLERIEANVRQKEKQATEKKQQTHIALLRQQDDYCCQLETDLLSPEALAQIQSAWQQLPSAGLSDGQDAMLSRYESALAAQQAQALVAGREQDLERAKAIALILEISADIASPKRFQTERQAMQLANLEAALNGDKTFEQYSDAMGRYRLIVEWYALPKGLLNEEASGYQLNDWRQRVENASALSLPQDA